MTRLWWSLPLLAALASCIGTSPEEEERAALGDAKDGDEEHRPGQPCLVCHREEYHPGGPAFVIAGTVYLRASDRDGVAGAIVEVTDAQGHSFNAPTNRVGNFMVEVRSGLDAPRLTRRGRLQIPWELEFPLQLAVRQGDYRQEMQSFAWREGSCAGCHVGRLDDEATVSKIFVIPEGM